MAMPARASGWVCRALTLSGDETLRAHFERLGHADRVSITVLRRRGDGADEGPAFRKLRHSIVRYEGHLSAPTAERKLEVAALVDGVARTVEARLASAPEATLAQALGRPAGERRRLVFGRETLRGLLEPDIVGGVPFAGGWVLSDVYPSSRTIRDAKSLELVLEFRHELGGRRSVIQVFEQDDERPAFARTTHLSLVHYTAGGAGDAAEDDLCAAVSFVLQLRDHEGLDLSFPQIETELLLALPSDAASVEEGSAGQALNIAIDADCLQQCVFCSIKELRPARDEGEAALARLKSELRTHRERGVEVLRVNGYDPLAFSHVVELLAHARLLGFKRAEIYSPCTTLADPQVCREIVEAAPPELALDIPLYGGDAPAHDAVVGRQGAFDAVMAAIENLMALVDRDRLRITTVVTRDALGELPRIAALAAGLGLPLRPHLPYPSSESTTDRYFQVVARQSDIVPAAHLARAHQPHLFVQGLAPCVVHRVQVEQGLDPHRWLARLPPRPALPGTEYRDESYRQRSELGSEGTFVAAFIPCPHESSCALSTVCSGEVHRAYVEKFGWEELRPVALHELLGGPPPSAD